MDHMTRTISRRPQDGAVPDIETAGDSLDSLHAASLALWHLAVKQIREDLEIALALSS